MNHSPAYILAQYLIDEGLLTDSTESDDWKVYVGSLPDGSLTGHNAVGCMDTAPVKDGRIMGGAPLFHHGIQLLIRSTGYNEGYTKASALAAALAEVVNEEVFVSSLYSYEIANVTQTTGVVVLGQEEGTKRREMFSVNFLATLKEV